MSEIFINRLTSVTFCCVHQEDAIPNIEMERVKVSYRLISVILALLNDIEWYGLLQSQHKCIWQSILMPIVLNLNQAEFVEVLYYEGNVDTALDCRIIKLQIIMYTAFY